jgi:hypothetical protein
VIKPEDRGLDEALREAGERWRSARPAPRAVDLSGLLGSQIRRRTRAPRVLLTATGAGLAAVLTLVGFMLADRDNRVDRPDVHATTSGIRPWAPLAPGPSPSPTTSPSPSPASSVRLCSSADVKLSVSPHGVGLGTVYSIVLLRNIASTPCQAFGAPRVTYGTYVSGDDSSLSDLDGGNPRPAVLAPGRIGGFDVGGLDSSCPTNRPVTSGDLLLHLPGGGTLPIPGSISRCPVLFSNYFLAVPTGDLVKPWRAAEYPTPSPTPPAGIDALTVTTSENGAATAGTAYDYTVTLHNPTTQPVLLMPCPTYDERTKSRYNKPAERYTLDCATAPVVPAGGQVTFAMRYQVPLAIPSGGQDDLIWWVEGHDSLIGNTQLTVIPAAVPASARGSTPGAPTAQCAASSLRLQGGRQGGGAVGVAQGAVSLTNTGTTSCTLSGIPTVQLLRANSTALAVRNAAPATPLEKALDLAPGKSATLVVEWTNWCGSPPGPLDIRLKFDGAGDVTGPFNGPPAYDFVPACAQPGQSSSTTVLDAYLPPGAG